MAENTNIIKEYWNHNTAYHEWIIKQVKGLDRVLDVGCGDGLLVERLSKVCGEVIGIDPHEDSIDRCEVRLNGIWNASVVQTTLNDFEDEEGFDAIVFVASLHHMDSKEAIIKAKSLLKKNGKLIIVGLVKAEGFYDHLIEVARYIPSKLSDSMHTVVGDVGAPISDEKESLKDIKQLSDELLPNAVIKRALHYRYLLTYTKD